MPSSPLKFIGSVALLASICAALQYYWNLQMPQNMHLQNGFLLLGIFVVSVTAIHLFLVSASNGDGQAFIRKFLAVTMFKFMFYIFILLVFLLLTSENKQALILHFLFYYAVFTVLEVSFLYSEIQKQKKK